MKQLKGIVFLLVLVIAFTALTACGGCKHKYVDGVCSECGEADPDYKAPCSHSYTDGVCSKCGASDPDYIPPCAHSYVKGACTLCGEACDHSYSEGVCSVCGAEDPDYIPADGGASMYEDIVEKFQYLILYKHLNEELPPKGSNEPFYVDALYEVAGEYNPSIEMGYAFRDIDGDGYSELLLMGRESRIYGMFTILNKEPALVATFQQGMGYIDPDGMIFYNSKEFGDNGGQIALEYHMTYLVDGQLVGVEYGWVDVDQDTIYYCVSEDGVRTELSYDEYKLYKNAYEYYWNYPTRLTRLNGFRFYTALIDSANPVVTADFSTYDAIINTFGLMYSHVAEGKYEKTKWTGGAYDSKMLFSSEEDYALYNKIIAACVLVQNNSKAVFGYALKDLNGDGADELILLDSKFYVLAIFTEIDGKPILLDTYTDLRSAFIDKNGYIHVAQRVIPGGENDYEYFVLEAGAGELVCKTAIGVKYSADATQDKIYKIVDGTAVNVEQAEWDALYAEYLADIGNTEFNTYTKNEAGLTFVAVPVN